MKRALTFVGVVVIGGFLALAAYRALQQLVGPAAQAATLPALALVNEDPDGQERVTEVGVTFTGAAELPDREPETWGVLLREEDNRYFVGSGPNSVFLQEIGGALTLVPQHEGPSVEVVGNRHTLFYEDVTDLSAAANRSSSGEVTVLQQVRQVEKPPQMPAAANFLVWGERSGNRVIAAVILFRDEGYGDNR